MCKLYWISNSWIGSKDLLEGYIGRDVLTTAEKIKAFRKYCRNLSLVDDVFMYKGRQGGPKVVPTPEQVFDLLCGVVEVTGKHSTDVQKHVRVLSKTGMYPISLGGLEAIVRE